MPDAHMVGPPKIDDEGPARGLQARARFSRAKAPSGRRRSFGWSLSLVGISVVQRRSHGWLPACGLAGFGGRIGNA